MTPVTPRTLIEMKRRREKIAALTAYDAATARLLNAEEVDVVLVGDSAANVKLGYENTLAVTVEEMLMLTRAVKRGNSRALLVADMPFWSYEHDLKAGVRQAGRFLKEGGAAAVKMEGATPAVLSVVKALTAANVPVMGHVGLTPQAVHRLGYRVQGRDARDARRVLSEARALEKAGAFALVAEAVPAALGKALAKALKIPVIGIGAGPSCDGQVLVVDDLLGLTPAPRPKFVRAYADLRGASLKAIRAWRADVKAGRFPGPAETY